MLAMAVAAATIAASGPGDVWRDFFNEARVEQVPPDVQGLIIRLQGCGHFGGEDAYNQERAADLAQSMRALRCSRLRHDVARARHRHRNNATTSALIAREAEAVGL